MNIMILFGTFPSMGKHDSHQPKKDLNKTVGHGAQPADSKTLERLARAQGTNTKQDSGKPQGKNEGCR